MTDRNAQTKLRTSTSEGKWVIATTAVGSAVALLTGTVVNVALPAIGRDLGAGVAGLQWILNGYMVALASLILIGGSLGDRYGRRRIYVVGVVWFIAASVLCVFAPTTPMLVAARVLQGIGGALLTPGSLAIIEASFHRDDRSTAIGAWSGFGGIAAAIGPLAGGWLVESLGWRWIFVIPIPAGLFVLWAARHLPESRDEEAAGDLDLGGAVLGAMALAGITFPVIQGPEHGLSVPVVVVMLLGAVGLVGFYWRERSIDNPMLPFDIFTSRLFTAANLLTFVIYAALGGVFFLLVVHLQVVVGYSALVAGAATLPITLLMLAGSPTSGRLAQRIGPRIPLTVGPLLLAAGMVLMSLIGGDANYWTGVLPAVTVFGIGLTITVAPVTATALAAAPDRHSGMASGINNAVARTAQLLAVAVLPVLGGMGGGAFGDPARFSRGFTVAMLVSAGLAFAGSVLAWTMIRSDALEDAPAEPEYHRYCAIEGSPEVISD